MKFAVIIALILWFACGLAGAWMMDDVDIHHWKSIARGPITLSEALDDDPVTFQGGN